MYNEKKMINCMYTLKEDEEYILKKIKDEFKWKMLDSEYDEKRIEITKNSDVLKQCIERGLFMEEVLNNPNLPSEYLENLLKDMTEFLCNSKFTQIKEIKNLCDKITKMHLLYNYYESICTKDDKTILRLEIRNFLNNNFERKKIGDIIKKGYKVEDFYKFLDLLVRQYFVKKYLIDNERNMQKMIYKRIEEQNECEENLLNAVIDYISKKYMDKNKENIKNKEDLDSKVTDWILDIFATYLPEGFSGYYIVWLSGITSFMDREGKFLGINSQEDFNIFINTAIYILNRQLILPEEKLIKGQELKELASKNNIDALWFFIKLYKNLNKNLELEELNRIIQKIFGIDIDIEKPFPTRQVYDMELIYLIGNISKSPEILTKIYEQCSQLDEKILEILKENECTPEKIRQRIQAKINMKKTIEQDKISKTLEEEKEKLEQETKKEGCVKE